MAADGLGFLGVEIEEQRNASGEGDRDISADGAVVHTLAIDAEKHKPYHLHPVQAGFDAADHRPALAARYDRATGAFTVPPRTAVVFVAGDRDRDDR